MTSLPLPHSIPVRVFLASLQEYNASIYQWQVHAESQSRELQSLQGKIGELERDNQEIRDCHCILQRMIETQRDLIISLEADLAQARGEGDSFSGRCDL
ncbi:hypothetical protein B0I35DRAFT_447231, partial [Stachybotrys elegans]